MSQSPVPIVRINLTQMRALFNEESFLRLVQNGRIIPVVAHSGTPAEDAVLALKLPPGTKSQMLSYRDTNNLEMARAHQYLLPDGTIGASGKPDPKRFFKDGILYRLEKKKNLETA
jgi:hypothetical protein